MQSGYMQFAKLRTAARYNLASSGVLDCRIEDLDLQPGAVALHGPNAYGYAPLVDRIAARFGADAACVVTAGGGTSFANHLALAAILSPGDEVLIERPTYTLITDTLRYLRAEVTGFARAPERLWRLEPDVIEAALTPRTKLVVLTNLHNPTGDFAGAAVIDAIARAAGRVGALVLVDEVYGELMCGDEGPAPTSFRADGNIVTTSSLTKAYGLSGLRCGWILAPAALATRMRRLNDLFGVLPPHPAECMAVAAFDRLAVFRARAAKLLAANRAAYAEILGDHPGLENFACPQGTTMFPRLRSGDGDGFYETLMEHFETSLVPGRFFGCPAHVRIGLAGDPAQTREALSRVADALRRHDGPAGPSGA
jgi:aspartate/methionine/tyrosine aminotransferase